MKWIINFIKGFIIGAFIFLPGIGGGTTAIILGQYDKLIEAASSLWKHPKKHIPFLFVTSVGVAIGAYLSANALKKLFEEFGDQFIYLILGFILGSVPLLFKKAKITDYREPKKAVMYIGWFVVGVICVIGINFIPTGQISIGATLEWSDIFLLALSGVILAIALILPGIGFMFVLLLLGLYDATLNAVGSIDLAFLIPLVLAVGVGILLTSNILNYMMKKFTSITYLVILGFVVGASYEFLEIPSGWNILYAFLLIPLGFLIVYKSSEFSNSSASIA